MLISNKLIQYKYIPHNNEICFYYFGYKFDVINSFYLIVVELRVIEFQYVFIKDNGRKIPSFYLHYSTEDVSDLLTL